MKKLVVFAVLAAIVASCADDNPPQIEKSSELVSPRLLMDVSTESGQSPLTGILTIMPCKAGTSIYYGNYINRKLTPFYGYYQVKDGAFYIIRKSKFPQNPKRSVRFSGKGTKRSVQKRKARNTQKAETKVL